MQAWEYPVNGADAARAVARSLPAGSEPFLHEDGAALLVLAGGAEPPGTPAVKPLSLRFSGGRFGPAAGDWLFFVGLWTPVEWRTEFLAWYQAEHLPMLLECPVWDGCRFVEQPVAHGCQFYAMHQFSDRAALDSFHRARSRATHWFARLARNPWFDGGFTRTLCRRLPP